MPTKDPEKFRAKAERRNAKRRANRAAARESATPKPTTHRKVYDAKVQGKGKGSTPESRAAASRAATQPERKLIERTAKTRQRAADIADGSFITHRKVYDAKPPKDDSFKAHPPPEWAPPNLNNPLMKGGMPLIAEIASCIQAILPLEELDTLGIRPEWIHWPTWSEPKWNTLLLYETFGNPEAFKTTPDGFAIRRKPGNGTPTERQANPFGNLRHRLYVFQDNYGETFIGKVQTIAPGFWTMTRELWEPWGWVAERYQAFGYLDTLNREHLEHGREWKIREWGPWWLTNIKGAFGPRATWSKRPGIETTTGAFTAPYTDPRDEASALWKNWLFFAADLCNPSSRSRILAAMTRCITSSGSIVKLPPKDDHNCIPGGVTVSRLLEVTAEWIARERPPSLLMPCSNQFREAGAL